MRPFIQMSMRYLPHNVGLRVDRKDIDELTRRGITRVCNCILALANTMVPVSEDTIRYALEASNVFTNLADLLLPGITPILMTLTYRYSRTISRGGIVRELSRGIDILKIPFNCCIALSSTEKILCRSSRFEIGILSSMRHAFTAPKILLKILSHLPAIIQVEVLFTVQLVNT